VMLAVPQHPARSVSWAVSQTLLCCVKGVGLEDLDVTEGGRETLKGRKLGGINLCHAAQVPVADDLGCLVGWLEARSARRSVRGGQNVSARRVGKNKI
jgi:hypothetical protein